MKILIVEDDEAGRDNLIDILELDSHSVVGSGTARDAISLCESDAFDSIILDWNLPEGTAEQFIPHIQKLQPGKPIIVVTGYGDVELVVSAMRTGVWDYIEKPINFDVLRATISRVAERKTNLDRLEKVQRQLVSSERLAAIGQMVAGLAHESRNAFQRSQACLEMLELNLQGDSENLEIVGRIQSALEQLQLLYEEVRNYAAPIVLERTDTDLGQLIQDTWVETGSQHNVDLNTLEIKCDSADLRIKLDRRRIQQVFRNLFENAIDAVTDAQNRGQAQKQDPAMKIRVDITQLDGEMKIVITDTGPGIPLENRKSVFEPFFTTKTKGTGLGLAISRRMVEAHDGALELTENDSATAFELRLPTNYTPNESGSLDYSGTF